MNNIKDTVIIGSGPAGLTAAIYASRAGVDTLVLEKANPGGKLWLYEEIENYPGYAEAIKSFSLASDMEKQARRFGAEIAIDTVVSLARVSEGFEIRTTQAEVIKSLSVIVATGTQMQKLGVKGEAKFTGKGVSYCAVCDGPLFRNKTVAVVGGGNTACEEALYLTRFAKKVVLIHRRPRLRAVKFLAEKVEKDPKIELILDKEIMEIVGNDIVKSLKLSDKSTLEIDGVFVFVGLIPDTDFLGTLLEMERGFIKTDNRMMTSQKGIFAAGDCRFDSFRQVITACSDGALAAEETRKYIETKKGEQYAW